MTTRDVMDVSRCRHRWKFTGGRACPYASAPDLAPECNGSQSVFQCVYCGIYDHGEKGGPGHQECLRFCGAPA